ncbi:helix-turn-helix domain-containing protein [Goodfellowiella coeruleoviolacea]|uniref:Helix-turn-helix domain-containing protein n=1 Tax=Goodfellowiella coeruleoviolacea TaxID=334858 RepID=A0AAE3KJ06_9PSEU|nr:helix-turn-helix transcriptional regulator [Goodfellowiella coeruleoviolacea]MCP2169791.1 Helix-turn-helix domain-containing protein [Goodfellowiella coeruleoviolacea]
MSEDSPIVQRLIFGHRVRDLRDQAGIELEAANKMLGWYRGKLSKVEHGGLALNEAGTKALLELYGVTGKQAEDLRRLSAEARRYAAPERVPDVGRDYVVFERAAEELRMIYPEVPGLIQTAEYARAQIMHSPTVPGSRVADMAAAREQRGEQLRVRPGQRVWIILGEEALRRIVGGPATLRRQLERVVEFAQLPHVSIRVLPFDSGSAPGLSCPFTLLYIAVAETAIAYTETLTGADYLRTTGAYSLAFEQAEQQCLSEDDTVSLLKNRIQELSDK